MKFIDRERWQRLEPLLDEALELTGDERITWLEALRTTAPDLADDVSALLSEEAAADRDRFMLGTVNSPLSRSALEGTRLGAYTLQRPIAEGGMGWVWLAQRTDGRFEGNVAVKLLNLALLSPTGQERFRREGSMLAQLSHAGIARLLDAGLAGSGQPYLVLEYIDGEPIDAFCDARHLPIRDRIRLVEQVLSAVSHAHANLIVHRDLKPSNILVTADGNAKLLDFGIAKLLSPVPAEDRTILTAHGRALTPDFAAPEQIRGDAITTATDVYAIGVLLYLLLTGKRPYQLAGLSASAMEQTICETDPPRPSAMFAAALSDREARAHARGGTADRLQRQLRGDLDAMVMKAMHKEPARRYSSVAALAEDLERNLNGRPVIARPDSLAYRTRKFAARNSLGLATAGVIATLLAGYVVTVLIDRARIDQALTEARMGTRKAEQVTDFMLGLFEASEGGNALTDTISAQQLLGRGLVQARELAGQPELQSQMHDVLGRLHMQLGNYSAAQPLLESALATRRRLYGERHADVATSLDNLAEVLERRENASQSVQLRREALALRRQLSGDDDAKSMDALFSLAGALHNIGNGDEAMPLFEEWMTRIARQPGEMTAARAQQLTAAGEILLYGGQPDRAEPLFREALSIRRRVFGDRHHLVAASLFDLAVLLDMTKRSAAAEPLLIEAIASLRATFPDGHPQLAPTLKNYGIVLGHLNRPAEAVSILSEAIALNRRFIGPNTLPVALTQLDLSYVLISTGNYQEAETHSRDALRILRAELGENSTMAFRAQTSLGEALRGLGRYREAEPLLLAAFKKFETPKPMTQNAKRQAAAALVRLYEAEGRSAEAERYRPDAVEPPGLPVKAAGGQ